MEPITLVRILGWSCIGFAAASAVAPRALGNAMGLGGRVRLVRALGARDFVVGAGMASAADPTPWLRVRLACEVADAVLHGVGAARGTFHPRRAGAVAAGATALAAFELALLSGALPD